MERKMSVLTFWVTLSWLDTFLEIKYLIYA